MPSPVYCGTVPSKRCTPSARRWKKRSMMPCQSSGSSCSASSIEPFTPANRTVTCLRSPSRADLECRILSARCCGVHAAGSGVRISTFGLWICCKEAPHSPQKLSPGSLAVPQAEQTKTSGVPQPEQNFRPSRFSCPQDAQVTVSTPGGTLVLLQEFRQRRAHSPIRSRAYRLVTSRVELRRHLLGADRGSHLGEEPVRLAQLALAGGLVAEDAGELGARDVHLGREDARLGCFDHCGSVAEICL